MRWTYVNMKKYSLLELFPAGQWNQSGNKVWAEHTCPTIAEAIAHFKTLYPEVNLDNDGYAKEGDQSFCVAEHFNPIQQ